MFGKFDILSYSNEAKPALARGVSMGMGIKRANSLRLIPLRLFAGNSYVSNWKTVATWFYMFYDVLSSNR